jgi:hypothetical protein
MKATCFHGGLLLSLYVPPKRRLTLNGLQGVIPQKMVLFYKLHIYDACAFRCSLNRRLEALSTTKFGSQDSGLNRVGLTVPNTNQHAVEGSNPVWGNEEMAEADFDVMR